MRSTLLIALGIIVGTTLSTVIAIAWTGPSSSPPSSNVSAPINVGSTDQVKNANLGVNGLAVFGNSLLQASSYLNWGATSGSPGYGIRDNAGTLEFKNSGGSWASIQSTIYSLGGGSQWTTSGTSIYYNTGNVGIGTAGPGQKLSVAGIIERTSGGVKFPDGTVQTTAPGAGGVTASTQVTCSINQSACTASCPAGYFMSGCRNSNTGAFVTYSGQSCTVSGGAATVFCVK